MHVTFDPLKALLCHLARLWRGYGELKHAETYYKVSIGMRRAFYSNA